MWGNGGEEARGLTKCGRSEAIKGGAIEAKVVSAKAGPKISDPGASFSETRAYLCRRLPPKNKNRSINMLNCQQHSVPSSSLHQIPCHRRERCSSSSPRPLTGLRGERYFILTYFRCFKHSRNDAIHPTGTTTIASDYLSES